jgi:hypothetical protein
MSLGYDTNSETLTGTIDVYANHIDTQTLTINGIDITGNVVGPIGPQGIQGVQGIQGPQGNQGQKGDNGSDANTAVVEAEIIVLGATVGALGVAVGVLGTTVAGLSTALTTVQGEVSVISGQVDTLANNTKFITSSLTKTIVSSELDITDGISNTIALKKDGTINASTLNVSTVNSTVANIANDVICPEIKTTNITPYTSPFGVINVATSGVGDTINIGNTTSNVYINGNMYFNNSLATDQFNLFGYVNQWTF